MALADGEFATDPYYERFARLHSQRNTSGKKPLVMEYEDGTPVGVDLPQESEGIQAPAPEVATAQAKTPSQSPPPPSSGCATACEGACQFPTESSPVSTDEINAGMDREPEPPLDEQPETVAPPPQQAATPPETAPTAADTMQTVEHQLEPGMAPPMPAEPSAAVPPPTPPGPVAAGQTAPPPPQVNEGVGITSRAEPRQVMEHFGLEDQHVLEVDPNWMKVVLDGEETYVSRLELGWKTTHLPSMKGHVTKLTGD